MGLKVWSNFTWFKMEHIGYIVFKLIGFCSHAWAWPGDEYSTKCLNYRTIIQWYPLHKNYQLLALWVHKNGIPINLLCRNCQPKVYPRWLFVWTSGRLPESAQADNSAQDNSNDDLSPSADSKCPSERSGGGRRCWSSRGRSRFWRHTLWPRAEEAIRHRRLLESVQFPGLSLLSFFDVVASSLVMVRRLSGGFGLGGRSVALAMKISSWRHSRSMDIRWFWKIINHSFYNTAVIERDAYN